MADSVTDLHVGITARAVVEAIMIERERCAKIAESPGFIQAQDTEWDEGVNYAKRFIAAAIRGLPAPVEGIDGPD